MLEPYRVLDLTDERGEIAGMMLGDLGADVIRVEPREGTPGRQRGPMLPEAPPGEASLQFFAYNRNKRSIALAIEEAEDRENFLRLVESADFVIESWPNSMLDAAGIDFETLRERQPQIVHVKITPFGVDGPYAGLAATDLTIAAMGGPVSLQGVAERAPLRVSVPQVWRHAGAEAAVAALVGHARMRQSGEAQFVDVSAQCALTWTTLNALGASAVQGHDFERMGSLLQLGATTLPLVFACLDGYVVAIPNGALMQALVHSMVADGVVDASWPEEDWANLEARLVFGEPIPHTLDEISDAFRRYFLRYTREDLFERALALSATVAPVKSIADLLDFQHLRERQFWVDANLPGGQRVSLPGSFARLPEALSLQVSPPRIDEHGDAIRAELAERPPAHEPLAAAGGELPFSGLKVADFSWIGVGPMTSKYLADHGATVVRVESESRPDNLRGVAPFKDGVRGWDRSHFFATMNSSKLGLALNLKNPAAIEAARRLIAWADVYVESFTPGTVEELGIGYEVARSLNPGIVMLSTCLMGQTGPAAKMAGYGYHAGAVAGFYEVTGWPDLPPDGPYMAYTDTIAPRFTTSILMAAIDHARRTGEGRHIDGAQLEMSLHFLAPEILDYQVNGRLAGRTGNRDRWDAPHGVYPCAGDDQWCAIAVENTAQWEALVGVVGAPAWLREGELATAEGRLARQEEIDAWISAWTRDLEALEVMEKLQAAAVPAGKVQRDRDLLADPQLAHRGFYRTLEHREMGAVPYAGHQFRVRGYENGPRGPAPCLGEHGFEVLEGLLGFSGDEIAELAASGGLG